MSDNSQLRISFQIDERELSRRFRLHLWSQFGRAAFYIVVLIGAVVLLAIREDGPTRTSVFFLAGCLSGASALVLINIWLTWRYWKFNRLDAVPYDNSITIEPDTIVVSGHVGEWRLRRDRLTDFRLRRGYWYLDFCGHVIMAPAEAMTEPMRDALRECATQTKLARAKCVQCGYSLRGLTQQRCPECGLPFNPKKLPRRIR